MITSSVDNKVLSVSQLVNNSRRALETHIGRVLVEGEISNLHCHGASGHWYFTLKDQGAQLRCAMFRSANQRVRLTPENGLKVRLRGSVSIYVARGDFQMIAESMQDAGLGDLQAAFEALKKRLLAEGLFAAKHKQALPEHPHHVAIITSGTGAAVADMLSVFARRSPATRITLIPVPVQGAGAAQKIADAIARANAYHQQGGELDAIITGRGGGSLEDLWAFNEEVVARAIFASDLPVVSAVGHETDFSISDLVADVRAPTPSAAAELLSTDRETRLEQLAAIEAQFVRFIAQRLQAEQNHLHHLRRRLQNPQRLIEQTSQRCDELERRLQRAVAQSLHQAAMKLTHLRAQIGANSPWTRLEKANERCDALEHRLHDVMSRRLSEHKTTLAHRQQQLQQLSPAPRISQLQLRTRQVQHGLKQQIKQALTDAAAKLHGQVQLLNSLSPLNTLERGYAIVTDAQGKVVTDASQCSSGDHVRAQVGRGELACVVEEATK